MEARGTARRSCFDATPPRAAPYARAVETATITACTVGTLPDRSEVVALYDAVEWSSYTGAPDTLMKGLYNALRVVVARVDGQLVGLARVVGDGATICYLQDVLVHPDVRRQGLGESLVKEAFAPLAAVRQHVLITDEEDGQRSFYESLGFTQLGTDVPGRAFVRFTY